jgi:hypothetical protein
MPTIAASRLFLGVTAVALLAQLTLAQQPRKITIQEPGIYKLEDLFAQADTVALVRIVAGDTEAYDIAIYKAEAIKSFKGVPARETIYFGPYVGERLGWEYIVFLRNVPTAIRPKVTPTAGYGTIHYAEIFNEGYTSMMTSYECVFDGKDIAQKCDYGVRVCTDYIRLPKSTPTFPPLAEDTPFGCRWVRKAVFVSLLDELVQSKRIDVAR